MSFTQAPFSSPKAKQALFTSVVPTDPPKPIVVPSQRPFPGSQRPQGSSPSAKQNQASLQSSPRSPFSSQSGIPYFSAISSPGAGATASSGPTSGIEDREWLVPTIAAVGFVMFMSVVVGVVRIRKRDRQPNTTTVSRGHNGDNEARALPSTEAVEVMQVLSTVTYSPSSFTALDRLQSNREGGAGNIDSPMAVAPCSICMERMNSEQDIRCLPCMHMFHDRCVEGWLLSSRTCPSCRIAVPDGV